MAYTMKEMAQRLSDATNLAAARRAEIDRMIEEIRGLKVVLEVEHNAHSKKSMEILVTVEKLVNMTAERDALLIALVAAYRTRKP